MGAGDVGVVGRFFSLAQIAFSVLKIPKVRSVSFRVLGRSLLFGSADRISPLCRKIMYRSNENL